MYTLCIHTSNTCIIWSLYNATCTRGIIEYLMRFLRFECDILNTLLVAQTTMSDWKFLTALLHIQEAHTKLTSWGALIQPREVRAKGHNPEPLISASVFVLCPLIIPLSCVTSWFTATIDFTHGGGQKVKQHIFFLSL